ncbi:hypothetical protein BRAO285_1090004 [Bradyrhizobium sp. ORS 285]|nr:hypothetical protein BRAO285_1090004 [Bradyrhizobium sp. ORS 285]
MVNVPFKFWFYPETVRKCELESVVLRRHLSKIALNRSRPFQLANPLLPWCPFPISSRKRGSRPAPCSIMARAS